MPRSGLEGDSRLITAILTLGPKETNGDVRVTLRTDEPAGGAAPFASEQTSVIPAADWAALSFDKWDALSGPDRGKLGQKLFNTISACPAGKTWADLRRASALRTILDVRLEGGCPVEILVDPPAAKAPSTRSRRRYRARHRWSAPTTPTRSA